MKKIEVAGGPAVTLCDAGSARGGSWDRNNVLLFAANVHTGILRVPATGGTATPVTELERPLGEMSHRFPWFLPDGRRFLYNAISNAMEETAVYVGDIDSKNRQRVLAANSNAAYAPPGYLLFMREQTNPDRACNSASPGS